MHVRSKGRGKNHVFSCIVLFEHNSIIHMYIAVLVSIFLFCECLDWDSLTGFGIHVLCQK